MPALPARPGRRARQPEKGRPKPDRQSGAIRYVVEDNNGRLFIHNAKQLGKQEGWMP